MFDEFRGLPLHALIVHATVVLLPMTALLGAGFLVPRLRALLRWPLLAATLVSLLLVFVTRQSGESLKESLNLEGPFADAVERHQDLADQLVVVMIVFTVLVVVAVVTARPARESQGATTSGGPRGGRAAVESVLAVLVLLASVALGVQTARVGEAGARAVWNPTGDTSFSGD